MSDFKYEVDKNQVTITRYKGTDEDVVIPDEIDGRPVTTIGHRAFKRCTSLTSITLPDSVTTIGDYAFEGCTGLTSITLPTGVTSIGSAAFWGCTSLTSITLPNSITAIGDWAFARCHSLTSISVPNGCSIGTGAFEDCPATITIRDKEDE